MDERTRSAIDKAPEVGDVPVPERLGKDVFGAPRQGWRRCAALYRLYQASEGGSDLSGLASLSIARLVSGLTISCAMSGLLVGGSGLRVEPVRSGCVIAALIAICPGLVPCSRASFLFGSIGFLLVGWVVVTSAHGTSPGRTG